MPRLIFLFTLLLVAGCKDEDGSSAASRSAGTVVISIARDPNVLFPPLAYSTEGREVTEQIYEYLADVGVGLNTVGDTGFVKELARDWTWSPDSLSIAFHIRPDARWHDGTRVVARDVRFTYGLYTDSAISSPGAEELEDIDSVSVHDSLTAVFWFNRRSPRQFFAAASQMLIMPEHLLAALPRDSLREGVLSRDPVGTGRYRFDRWIRGSRLELRAVPNHYRGQARIARLIWTISPDFNSAIAKVLGGEADIFDGINRETLREFAGRRDFNITTLPAMDYAFMRFNLRDRARPSAAHPLFGSRDLRRALTMGVDRESIVRNLFDTLGAVNIGPTVRALPTTDTALKQLPYDLPRAEALLDSLGWVRSGTGIRMRGGKTLSFSVLAPMSSANRRKAGVLLQAQLRRIGAEVALEELEGGTFEARQTKRDFDAVLSAWTLGSSPAAVRATWTSRAARSDGLNFGAYTSSTFDALVDSAMSTGDVVRARDYFRRANQTIIDDAPAIWLYEPRKILAIHRRINTVAMRPNAWWLEIGHWSIPANEQIARDRASGVSAQRESVTNR
jgi:peptide/nickel transport system substrate-binding protein